VFAAIHQGRPDQALLSYQYLQMLPKIAQGDANKVWIVPSEIGKALEGLGAAVGKLGGQQGAEDTSALAESVRSRGRREAKESEERADQVLQSTESEVAAAIAEAADAARGGVRSRRGRTNDQAAGTPPANGDVEPGESSRA
jgi:hypothetical protein